MGLLIFYLFFALLISFLCSIMEAVLLSIPLSYLLVKKEKGSRTAGSLIKLKNRIDQPLSAILSLNTVAHTLGAAGVGAQATMIFGEMYFGLVSAVLTLLILIFSEIIPKTIGARYWRQLAIFVGKAVLVTIIITYPLVLLSALFTQLFSKKDHLKTTSREEFSALAKIGREEGIFGEKENKIIQNILRLKNLKVGEIMTPRVVVSAAEENMVLKDFPKVSSLLRFSRIPVYNETFDNITGFVFRQDVFEKLSEKESDLKLKDLKRDILITYESRPILGVWEELLERKQHIAVVVDEFGGLQGVVTMEDIIETLLGFEILDETDTVTDMQEFARQRWKKRQDKYKYIMGFDNEAKSQRPEAKSQ
ncbi:MAG: hemolysin family protein [Bacteroidales bacterium]|nr:hemolysin family protein [Bacteroidales bacterium]